MNNSNNYTNDKNGVHVWPTVIDDDTSVKKKKTKTPGTYSQENGFELQWKLIKHSISTQDELKEIQKTLKPSQLEDVMYERSSSNRCGHVGCSRKPKPLNEKVFKVDYKNMKVWSQEDLNHFCSEECYLSFNKLKSTLADMPAFYYGKNQKLKKSKISTSKNEVSFPTHTKSVESSKSTESFATVSTESFTTVTSQDFIAKEKDGEGSAVQVLHEKRPVIGLNTQQPFITGSNDTSNISQQSITAEPCTVTVDEKKDNSIQSSPFMAETSMTSILKKNTLNTISTTDDCSFSLSTSIDSKSTIKPRGNRGQMLNKILSNSTITEVNGNTPPSFEHIESIQEEDEMHTPIKSIDSEVSLGDKEKNSNNVIQETKSMESTIDIPWEGEKNDPVKFQSTSFTPKINDIDSNENSITPSPLLSHEPSSRPSIMNQTETFEILTDDNKTMETPPHEKIPFINNKTPNTKSINRINRLHRLQSLTSLSEKKEDGILRTKSEPSIINPAVTVTCPAGNIKSLQFDTNENKDESLSKQITDGIKSLFGNVMDESTDADDDIMNPFHDGASSDEDPDFNCDLSRGEETLAKSSFHIKVWRFMSSCVNDRTRNYLLGRKGTKQPRLPTNVTRVELLLQRWHPWIVDFPWCDRAKVSELVTTLSLGQKIPGASAEDTQILRMSFLLFLEQMASPQKVKNEIAEMMKKHKMDESELELLRSVFQ